MYIFDDINGCKMIIAKEQQTCEGPQWGLSWSYASSIPLISFLTTDKGDASWFFGYEHSFTTTWGCCHGEGGITELWNLTGLLFLPSLAFRLLLPFSFSTGGVWFGCLGLGKAANKEKGTGPPPHPGGVQAKSWLRGWRWRLAKQQTNLPCCCSWRSCWYSSKKEMWGQWKW